MASYSTDVLYTTLCIASLLCSIYGKEKRPNIHVHSVQARVAIELWVVMYFLGQVPYLVLHVVQILAIYTTWEIRGRYEVHLILLQDGH